ncbi:unnamed protein product [Rotaria sordida]|uniref:Ion transport domain-containing protein n=1 Tax=Rotaria sordida TaxID=392033 RepID=A0A815N299_9BILA|nr:unnamed protein product [Rotaria sordida]
MYNSTVYVEQGQYLAIGFDKNSRSPSYLNAQSSCYILDIDAVNRVYMANASIEFQRSPGRVAISFQIILTSAEILTLRLNVQFSGRRSWPRRIIYDRLKDFFGGRAIIRYYYNIIFYVLMLCLFSFVMLVDYFPYNNNQGKRSGYSIGISIPEIFLHLCIWGLIIEEAVEFGIHYHQQKKSTSHIRTIISSYFLDDRWNILDAIAIFIYLVGFITRFIVIEQAFVISKICMCIDLFLWYVRILHLFFAYERLGPKLLMIFNTMKDLAFFIYFIFVFLVAYSISSFALITTPHLIRWIPNENGAPSRTYNIIQNRTDFSAWSLLRNVIDWGVWKIYGQVDLIEYRQVSEATLTGKVYHICVHHILSISK